MSNSDMTLSDSDNTEAAASIFSDPVAYLARFGVEAELVAETTLPVAA